MRAYNLRGWGAYQTVTSAGATAKTIPDTMATPTKGSTSNENQIEVDWSALSSPNNGDSSIISYNLQWDAGTSGNTWTDIIGASPYSTVTTYTISSGITSGSTYRFRVRARNIYGLGSFSSELSVLAAVAPS